MDSSLARWVLLAALVGGSSGCLWKRTVTTFEDHPVEKVTTMETQEQHLGFLTMTDKRVFWMCQEDGDRLRCRRECDGKDQPRCPAVVTYAMRGLFR